MICIWVYDDIGDEELREEGPSGKAQNKARQKKDQLPEPKNHQYHKEERKRRGRRVSNRGRIMKEDVKRQGGRMLVGDLMNI